MISTPTEWAKTLSDPGSRVPGSWQDLWHVSRNFGELKDRTELDLKGGYERNALQQKYRVLHENVSTQKSFTTRLVEIGAVWTDQH